MSTKCSEWAIVTVRRPSVCECVNFFIQTTSLKPFIGFWPNFTGMIPGWSSTQVVQTVPVGCISRSQGQKIGFQNAIFRNILVWNNKDQSCSMLVVSGWSFGWYSCQRISSNMSGHRRKNHWEFSFIIQLIIVTLGHFRRGALDNVIHIYQI